MTQLTAEDYTKHRIAEEGSYRGFPVAWTIERADSGAVALAFKFGIWNRWHGKEHGWSEQFPTGWFVEARVWIVKKSGDLADGAIKNLQACGLWDGDFEKIEGPVANVFVLLDVEKEVYEGTEYYRAQWVNPDAAEPRPRGQFAPVDKGVLNSLRAKYQAKARAIAGGSPVPSGPPPAPPGIPGAGVASAIPQGAPAAVAALGVPTAAPVPAPGPAPFVPPAAPPAAPAPFAPPSPPAAPAASSAPLGAPPGAAPMPPSWGGVVPATQPARSPGTPQPAAPGVPPPVAVDPDKPPF